MAKGPIWKEYKDEDVQKGSNNTKYRECKHCGTLVCAVSTRLISHFKSVCSKRPHSGGQLSAGGATSPGEGSSMHAQASDATGHCLPQHSPPQFIVTAIANPTPNKRSEHATQQNLSDHGDKLSTRTIEQKAVLSTLSAKAIHRTSTAFSSTRRSRRINPDLHRDTDMPDIIPTTGACAVARKPRKTKTFSADNTTSRCSPEGIALHQPKTSRNAAASAPIARNLRSATQRYTSNASKTSPSTTSRKVRFRYKDRCLRMEARMDSSKSTGETSSLFQAKTPVEKRKKRSAQVQLHAKQKRRKQNVSSPKFAEEQQASECPRDACTPAWHYGPGGVPVIMPTWEQFEDFNKFIGSLPPEAGFDVGLCKVIPPKEWTESAKVHFEYIDSTDIEYPVRQVVTGKSGYYEVINVAQPPISAKEYEKRCRKRSAPHRATCAEDFERRFWKSITSSPAFYGSDCFGSLFDDSQKSWNIANLGDVLDILTYDVPGINKPYLYFGEWKAMFPWHTEDVDLFSINYIHFGASKHWYCVSTAQADRFERVAQSFFPESYRECPEFLRHKSFMMSPKFLRSQGLTVSSCVHEAGEFMITFPRSYHAGFNAGFNCAESVNFATPAWFEYGLRANHCRCHDLNVSLDVKEMVQNFARRFEGDSMPQWLSKLLKENCALDEVADSKLDDDAPEAQ